MSDRLHHLSASYHSLSGGTLIPVVQTKNLTYLHRQTYLHTSRSRHSL